jgi:glycosyltransferase involved in cell wall biosynthesis
MARCPSPDRPVSHSVVIVPGGTGGTGGLSIDVRNLANGLAARGHEVVVASADASDPALLELEQATVLPLRRRGPASLAATFGLYTGIRRVLRQRPSAVVHVFASMPSYVTFAALIAARLGGHRVVWTPMFHPLRRRVWRRRVLLWPMLLFDAVLPHAARLTDAIGAATEAEAAVFAKRAKHVELLPPVVEPAAVLGDAEASDFREATGVGPSPLVVVVASRDEPRKGLQFAWNTFERLRRDLPTARLVVVGLADVPFDLPAGVLSLGRVDDKTLTCALRAADVVFVPSLFEAFSRVVIEAWQQETPVVVSDGVALAPVVQRVGTMPVRYGNVAGAAAELHGVLSDRARGGAAGEAGRSIVESEFFLPTLIARLETVYSQPPAGQPVPSGLCAGEGVPNQ